MHSSPGSSPARGRRLRTALAVAGSSLALLLLAGLPATSQAGPGCAIRPVTPLGSHPAWPGRAMFEGTGAWQVGPMARSQVLLPGLWIAIDPVTRRPVPPSVEQRLGQNRAPLAPERDEILPVQRIPGGGELIHLNGSHMVYEVARRDASGHFRTTCAEDSVTAARIVATPVPTAKAVDR